MPEQHKPVFGLIVLFALCLFASSWAAEGSGDFFQAEMMLDFLRGASEGRIDTGLIDSIMAAEGTKLIIAQQNRRARIDSAQYRHLLERILEKDAPHIAPLDSTERAALGVDRLQNEIWPVLKWGMDNIGVLERRLAHLKETDIAHESRAIAESNLPVPLSSTPDILFVAGGRAGFFAADNCTYMDMLVLSFSRTMRGESFVSKREIIDYFAHEMHHVGFDTQMDRLRTSLTLDGRSERALGFVAGLVSEGSATYLINGSRDIEKIKKGRSYASFFAMGDDLLRMCDDILKAILNGEIESDDDYSIATRPLLGMGLHSAGSMMMNVIDLGSGIESIMRVIEDPRVLLLEYDKAADRIQSKQGIRSVYRFDRKSAEHLANLNGSDVEP